MLVTAHWSATPPVRLRDYHVEFIVHDDIAPVTAAKWYAAKSPEEVDFNLLFHYITIYKNFEFGSATDYGTWKLNHDPRDETPNVEVAALCMGTDRSGRVPVTTAGPWGPWPYTKTHAWAHAAIIARICSLKNIDISGTFQTSVEPSVLQNGPIYNVSTHGERAIQTIDPDDKVKSAGYFAYGGDPDCRDDLAALDVKDAGVLTNLAASEEECRASAAWIRTQAHAIKVKGFEDDLWGLDRAPN